MRSSFVIDVMIPEPDVLRYDVVMPTDNVVEAILGRKAVKWDARAQ
jgi:hypothetical protein